LICWLVLVSALPTPVILFLSNTYKAGYTLETKRQKGHITHYYFNLAINVSFINKKGSKIN